MHGAAVLVGHDMSLGASKSVSFKKISVKFENSFKKVLEIKKSFKSMIRYWYGYVI
jgi:hypothetical protein